MVPDKLPNNYEKINDIGLFECAVVCYKQQVICAAFLSTLKDPNWTQDNQMNTK
jgi:hypothetical protein